MIQNKPLPVEVDLQVHCALYPSIFNDVKDLQKDGLVHVMRCIEDSQSKEKKEDHKVLLYYLDPKFNFMRVDDDIKALWHAAGAMIQKEEVLQMCSSNAHKRIKMGV